MGPASVVVPTVAMYFAIATVLGVLLLGEGVRPTKVAGVILAAGSILLLTR